MKQPLRIGLVMKSRQADFFREMEKGACLFAEANNTFQLFTTGTSNQTEIDLQIKLIEGMISDGMDAIVVVPIDSTALVPVVVKAVRAGIKVINIDIRLDETLLAENGVELAYVGPDNETAAKAVGDILASQLNPGDGIILIDGLRVAENAQQRHNGFIKSMDQAGLRLLGCDAADWETEKAEIVFRRLFAHNPDVDGILCCNDAMALGVIRVLAERQLTGIIPVVGFDNDFSMREHLKSGALLATVDAYGSQMAVQGIKYALKVLDGMENKGTFNTPFTLIRGN
ncbi:MAG: substrate-binding domain-containing protein [Bacteroidota bacterium]|nr:substrate-binding domain-containing protein [Bacteroidota bacterium]